MKYFSSFVLLLISVVSHGQLAVSSLSVENKPNAIGVVSSHPRFSWKLSSDDRGAMQTAYQIQVGSDRAALKSGK